MPIKKALRVLGIETSCDETAVALVEISGLRITPARRSLGAGGDCGLRPWHRRMRTLSSVVASQVKLHAKTGGIVPEVAAREHVKVILPVIRAALRNAARELRITPARRSLGAGGDCGLRPDVIAVTVGPGLITSLMVGVETARTLSAAWDVPLVAVNHLEGHILASFLNNPQFAIHNKKIFPIMALLVSGGHTELVLMRRWLDYKVVGETLDDAAGEAFDKVAKILGLGYPGGPAIERAAAHGDPTKQSFTPPMLGSNDLNFSFSGIKTAVLYRLKELRIADYGLRETKNDIAAGFQKAVIDTLVAKTVRAAQQYEAKTIILCGGVAANTALRSSLAIALHDQFPNSIFLIPDSSFCTDNAAMIAAAGALRALHGKFTPWEKVKADPTLALSSSSRAAPRDPRRDPSTRYARSG